MQVDTNVANVYAAFIIARAGSMMHSVSDFLVLCLDIGMGYIIRMSYTILECLEYFITTT